MDDFLTPRSTTPPIIWDVYLLPVGRDIFGATAPGDLRQIVVEGRNFFEANQHADVLRVVRKGFYVIDAQPAGTVSSIVRQIAASARAAADRAERDAWERGETSDLVRSVVGSRPLGGGY